MCIIYGYIVYSIYYVFNVIRHRLCSIYYIVYVTLYIYIHTFAQCFTSSNKLVFRQQNMFCLVFYIIKKTCISSTKQCYKLGCISHTTKICKIKKVLHLGPLFLVTTCNNFCVTSCNKFVANRNKFVTSSNKLCVTSCNKFVTSSNTCCYKLGRSLLQVRFF